MPFYSTAKGTHRLQVEAEKMDEALLQAKQALWAGDSDASELLNSAHTQVII